MYIVQGDHGISIPFTVQKYAVAEDLTGATVEVAIKYGDNNIVRAATITDAINGECSFTVTSSDLAMNSVYSWQWTAYFPDGRIYSGRSREFYASERLIAGSAGGEFEPVIVPFATKEELGALQELVEQSGGGTVPSNVILFEDWAGGESVTIDTSVTPPADTTAPVLTITSGGTFTGTKSVTMTVNGTATVYYTLDGSTPTTSSSVYSSPLSISATTTLKAFARDTAGNQSAVQTVTYTLDTTQPADTTAPNNVTNLAYSNLAQTTLTLSWTASASSDVASYDVFNGSTLLANVTGTTYNVTGLTASTQYTFTIKAKDGANNTASGTSVTVTTSAPADTTAPVLTITPSATFTDTQTVIMSTNETATIWYTLDDSDPVSSATRLQYTAPLTLTATDTIKAYAVDIANNASVVQTVTYTKETAPVGTYVNDASLLFYKNNPTNGETIPNPENYFNETEPFTLSVTFKPVVSGSNAANLLVSRWALGGSENVMKLEFTWNNLFHAFLFGTKADGTTAWSPAVQVNTAQTDYTKYYHVVFKREGTKLSLFIDGVLALETAILTTDIVRQTSSLPLIIGQSGKAGLFKNVAYYNRALTSAELTQNYNALK
jgi:hypothetical protein